MATHCAQGLVLLVATLVLSSYSFCELVSGIASRQSEASYEMETYSPKHLPVEKNKLLMENGDAIELFPVSDPHIQLQFNSSRRKLGDFMSCSPCTCCDSARTTCLSVPCCFTISCSVQPFGFCKFVPVTCNCQGCNL